jgi:Ca2+-binding EF-hand superfamily protein
MDIDELTNMLAELKVEVNTQLIRIILAIFDHDQNQMIDIGEFKSVLEKYLIKAPIDA